MTIVTIGKLPTAGLRALERGWADRHSGAAVSSDRIRESSTRSWVASASEIPRCRSLKVFLFRSWILSMIGNALAVRSAHERGGAP